MVFSIICAIIVVAVVAVTIQERSDGTPWGEVAGEAGAVITIGVFLGGLLLFVSGAVSNVLIHPDRGWELQSETVYTVAEDSNVVADGGSIEFVESRDGKLESVELYIDGDLVYAEDSGASRTVTVREEFRELGSAIFPWGVGDFKLTATIK